MEYIDRRGQAQFDHSHLQNSKLKFQKGHWAKLIYHYTSIGGLESILRNKTLRFTNIKYMNDKDEVIAGLDSIAKDCRSIRGNAQTIAFGDYKSWNANICMLLFS